MLEPGSSASWRPEVPRLGQVSDQRHVRVRELFLAACERTEVDRRAFLSEACGGDDELRREVESLLCHHQDRQPTVGESASGPPSPVPLGGSATGSARRGRTRFEAGDIFAGRYRIISELGRGGMGEVMRARDLVLDEPVAIKLLTRSGSRLADRAHLTLLLNEVRMARQVTHPNVCRVFDFGEAEGETFLTMEYVDGEDLGSLLGRIGRLPRDKLLDVAHQLASGLAAAHARGVLHRDLKPANVLIDGRGQVRITDFGIAVSETPKGDKRGLLSAGVIAGTPAYMAPEQVAGGEVSARSDLYALGLVLHEMATGVPVFDAQTPAAYAELHRASVPAPPSRRVRHIDPELEAVILRCLEKDPRDRPASALAVAAALPGGDRLRLALAAGETPSPEVVAAAGRDRGPGGAAALLATLLLLLAGLLVLGDEAYPGRATWASKPPEVLADQASTILRELGYEQAPRDRAWGFLPVGGINKESGVFWYRQGPSHLVPSQLWVLYYPRVDFDDPPPSEEGVRLLLDAKGRLLMLHAASGHDDGDAESGEGEDGHAEPPVDWAPVLTAAGFEIAALATAEPEVTPPMFADQRAAWTAAGRLKPIEAAASGRRVVYFDARVSEGTDEDSEQGPIDFSGLWDWYLTLSQIFWFVLALAAIRLAWGNVKTGRGDLRGARRLAIFAVVLNLGAWLLEADNVPDFGAGAVRLQATMGRVLLEALVAWLAYIALEPTVRRWWPRALIAWSRLLRGRPSDPVVGRALLIGAVVGTGWALLTQVDRLATRWLELEDAGEIFILPQLEVALSGRLAFANVLASSVEAVTWGVLDLFFLVALRVLLKRWWPALAIFVVVNALLETLEGIHPAVSWLTLGVGIAGVTAFVLMRFGLLTHVAALFCYFVLVIAPTTLDFGAWFADTGLFALALVAGVGVFGFWTALRSETRSGQVYTPGRIDGGYRSRFKAG